MARTVFDLEVWTDGKDEPLVLHADQRDMAAFELEYKVGSQTAMDDMPMVFFRFMGWSAAQRQGLISDKIGRDTWLADKVEITPMEDDEDENENPTGDAEASQAG